MEDYEKVFYECERCNKIYLIENNMEISFEWYELPNQYVTMTMFCDDCMNELNKRIKT